MEPRARARSVRGWPVSVLGCLVGVWSVTACPANSKQADEVRAVTEVLRGQEAAWNRGDIASYMEGYWKSPDLRFASGGNVEHGWEATAQGYSKRYPDKAAMGHLDFELIEVRVFSASQAMVFGRWKLTRAADTPSGLFTLILEKKPEGWRVVHDHTSSASQ